MDVGLLPLLLLLLLLLVTCYLLMKQNEKDHLVVVPQNSENLRNPNNKTETSFQSG
jgi:hypothetical protein